MYTECLLRPDPCSHGSPMTGLGSKAFLWGVSWESANKLEPFLSWVRALRLLAEVGPGFTLFLACCQRQVNPERPCCTKLMTPQLRGDSKCRVPVVLDSPGSSLLLMWLLIPPLFPLKSILILDNKLYGHVYSSTFCHGDNRLWDPSDLNKTSTIYVLLVDLWISFCPAPVRVSGLSVLLILDFGPTPQVFLYGTQAEISALFKTSSSHSRRWEPKSPLVQGGMGHIYSYFIDQSKSRGQDQHQGVWIYAPSLEGAQWCGRVNIW